MPPQFNRTIAPSDSPSRSEKNQLYPFKKTRGDGRVRLQDLTGKAEVDAITACGNIEFTAVGDTGKGDNTQQSEVMDAMRRDFDPQAPAAGATFFLNLGDIIYGPGKKSGYANKFYRPNASWLKPAPGFHGIILGIPGNHDGEERDPRDKPSLNAYMENFCQPTHNAPMADSFDVTMPRQPGPYWWLDAPFLDLIGLYSNAAEDFGVLGSSNAESHQQNWLLATLKTIAAARKKGPRKALVIATHHPPYNQGLNQNGQGHAGSPQMLQQIDQACNGSGVYPDLFVSGHSHNYQRYMRTVALTGGKAATIPYLIAGTGGIGSQPVPFNIGNTTADKKVVYSNALGAQNHQTVYGYLRIRASGKIVQSTFVQTLSDHRSEFETVAIDLNTREKTTPEFD